METITCIGKDNQSRTFELCCVENPFKQRWTFFAYTDPRLPSGENYQASFVADPDDLTIVRSVGMFAHAPEYQKVGLPEATILHAAKVIGRRIVSSRNNEEKSNGEYRSLTAEKVWQRLVSQGLATYDNETDSFATNL